MKAAIWEGMKNGRNSPKVQHAQSDWRLKVKTEEYNERAILLNGVDLNWYEECYVFNVSLE